MRVPNGTGILIALALFASACDGPERPTAQAEAETRATASAPPPVPAAERDARPLVVFLGDSLTAGLGVAEQQAFPAVVTDLLEQQGRSVRAVNAGVSGDTSAGGLARLAFILDQRPAVLVVGLGANDGLRGLPIEMTEQNLRALVARARQRDCEVLLLAMHVPPSYGADYAGAFHAIYASVAADLDVPLVADFLAGVGGEPDQNQEDGLHPNVEGHRRLAANVLPELSRVVARVLAEDGS